MSGPRSSRRGGGKENKERDAVVTRGESYQVNCNIGQHLDPVPCSTPVRHVQQSKKKLRTFPSFLVEEEQLVKRMAGEKEDLVPIRLDMELDGRKLRDVFTWNRNEKNITPEMFAEMLCDDLELNPGVFVNPISSTIRAQIEQTNSDNTNKEVFKEAHDRRVIIKLNIQVGNTNLVDQFEWDMADNKNCPEYFSKVLCQELGLAGEFYTAIAYQIRGQLALHKQNFTEALPSIQDGGSLMRDHSDIDQWAPYVETLTDHEMEKKVRDQDRNTRRMRRLQNAF